MMNIDTATETQVVTVVQPQPLEAELFGAGTRVRERATKRVEVTIEFDDMAFRRALEAIPLPQLDEGMEQAHAAIVRAIAAELAIPSHYLWRADAHTGLAPGVGPSPVERAAVTLDTFDYLGHWHAMRTFQRAPAAWCTPTRRPVTGRCRCAMGLSGEGGGE
jgi:hypothetical protein